MKITINFTIEYEQPKTEEDYKELLKVIKNYFENDMSIPCTKNVSWKSVGKISISQKIQ